MSPARQLSVHRRDSGVRGLDTRLRFLSSWMATMKANPNSADKILQKATHAAADDYSEHVFHALVSPGEENRASSAAQVHRGPAISRAVDDGHGVTEEESG